MSRELTRLTGSGGAGQYVVGDKFKEAGGFTPLRDNLDLLALAALARNLYVGGSEVIGLAGDATGSLPLLDYVPWSVDNTGSQISGFTDGVGGATLVVQLRFFVRVSDGAISVTPKVWYGSAMDAIGTGATLTGAAACTATNDDYSGADQIQTVALTLPAGAKFFKAGLTIAGTPAPDLQVWGRAYYDCYVQS